MNIFHVTNCTGCTYSRIHWNLIHNQVYTHIYSSATQLWRIISWVFAELTSNTILELSQATSTLWIYFKTIRFLMHLVVHKIIFGHMSNITNQRSLVIYPSKVVVYPNNFFKMMWYLYQKTIFTFVLYFMFHPGCIEKVQLRITKNGAWQLITPCLSLVCSIVCPRKPPAGPGLEASLCKSWSWPVGPACGGQRAG